MNNYGYSVSSPSISVSPIICPNNYSKFAWRMIKTRLAQVISSAVKVIVITYSACIFAPTWMPPTHKGTNKAFSLSGCSVSTRLFWWVLCSFPSSSPCVYYVIEQGVPFPMKPDIVTVRSGMFFTRWVTGCVHISWPVPQKHPFEAPLFAHSLFMNETGA